MLWSEPYLGHGVGSRRIESIGNSLVMIYFKGEQRHGLYLGRLGSSEVFCLSLERLEHACWFLAMVWKRKVLVIQGEGNGMLRYRILAV